MRFFVALALGREAVAEVSLHLIDQLGGTATPPRSRRGGHPHPLDSKLVFREKATVALGLTGGRPYL